MYYPDRIADDDDDDELSCASSVIEGGLGSRIDSANQLTGSSKPQAEDGDNKPHTRQCSFKANEKEYSWRESMVDKPSYDESYARGRKSMEVEMLCGQENAISTSRGHSRGECCRIGASVSSSYDNQFHVNGTNRGGNNVQNGSLPQAQDQIEIASLIQKEKNRRLGIQNEAINQNPVQNDENSSHKLDLPVSSSGTGVLGNIRGWFAERNNCQQSMATSTRSKSQGHPATVASQSPNRIPDRHSIALQLNEAATMHSDSSTFSDNDSPDDNESSSSDEELSDTEMGEHGLNPQERARARALKHLSNSCVDAGRKAKTASYIRGLERLDLKRKRDRYEKELEVMESEMNKDRGLGSNIGFDDELSILAAKLGRQLPRIHDGDADAGAGGSAKGREESSQSSFMLYDEYVSDEGTIWENKEAADAYDEYLQSQLKEAAERTRSLEKRLVVMEQAGDDIISSLCEDLAEVTSDANRTEARYVKKGKELQRKRRREEMRNRSRIKQAEQRIRKLEVQLLAVSGGVTDNSTLSFGSSDSGSMKDENDDEDDEIYLENKLSSIKAKSDRDKSEHCSEVESIQRQCEQLKLKFKVARLVMEGDDNLREYIALLERFDPSHRHQRKRSNFMASESDFFSLKEKNIIDNSFPCPPSKIMRTRAKLLKVQHLEQIYNQRLAISKAFADATINALEEELSEREQSNQKMEVRCLNDLMMIDTERKKNDDEANLKMAALIIESKHLEEAVAACSSQNAITGMNIMCLATNVEEVLELQPEGKMKFETMNEDSGATGGSVNLGVKLSDEVSEDTDVDDSHSEVARSLNKPCPEFKSDEKLVSLPLKGPSKPQSCDSRANSPSIHAQSSATLFDAELFGSPDRQPEDNRSSVRKVTTFPIMPQSDLTSEDELMVPHKKTESETPPSDNNVNSDENDSDYINVAHTEGVALASQPSTSAVKTEGSHDESEEYSLRSLSKADRQNIMLGRLGRTLKSNMAEYQTSFDSLSSSDRVKQLNCMNDLLLNIANIQGIEITYSPQEKVESWAKKKCKKRKSDRKSDKKSDKDTLEAHSLVW